MQRILTIYHVMAQARQEDGLDWLWIREIARRARMHPEIVRRTLDAYLREATEELAMDVLLEKGLRIRAVRLKDKVNIRGHLRYLLLMGRL